MANKQILVTKEKCLDCYNFVRAGLLDRFFVCRFGLVPVVMEGEEKGKASIVCQKYIDRVGERAPAIRLFNKIRAKTIGKK